VYSPSHRSRLRRGCAILSISVLWRGTKIITGWSESAKITDGNAVLQNSFPDTACFGRVNNIFSINVRTLMIRKDSVDEAIHIQLVSRLEKVEAKTWTKGNVSDSDDSGKAKSAGSGQYGPEPRTKSISCHNHWTLHLHSFLSENWVEKSASG
jgi:hypothetical protein